MKRRIYLSGGMSGVERADYVRRFGEAEAILRRHGYGCINPCRVWACRWPWIYRAMEWQEYICDAAEFGFDTPNLRSFVRGCPRTSAETFKHLREIKAMLNDAIQDEKERMKNGKQNNPY